MKSECRALSERFAELPVGKLLDVKFFIKNTDEATPDMVLEEIHSLLDAREKGFSTPLSFGDATIRSV